MKHKLILLSLCIFLITACGANKSSESNTEMNRSTSNALTAQEKELVTKLLERGTVSQNELMLELGKLDNYTDDTLKRLDLVLEIDCTEVSNQCSFVSKI